MTGRHPQAGELPVHRVASAADASAVLTFLARLERGTPPPGWEALAVPMVDESESARLQRLAADELVEDEGWTAVRADRAGRIVGYAGVRGGSATSSDVVAELAIEPDDTAALIRLAGELAGIAHVRAARRLTVWLRRVTPEQQAAMSPAGFTVGRQLAVLGVDDAHPVAPTGAEVHHGIRLRRYRPGDDDGGVIAVLDAAYRDGPEGSWDAERFAAARRSTWFRADDLVVAEQVDDGRIVGVHWTKRRSATLGEVHNLAVDPRAHGSGIGGRLLDAGLVHLRQAGCTRVILWVDQANATAASLYAGRGFRPLWQDVAFHWEQPGGGTSVVT